MSCASDNCDEAFKSESNVFDHTKVYSASEPYARDESEIFSKGRCYVSKHNEGPCVLHECKKCFKKCKDLRTHMKLVHSTSRSYTCDKCKKSFKTKSGLKQHMTVHSTSRPYKCDKCTLSFKTYSSLKQHKANIHSTSRPYMCGKCKKSFKTKNVLKQHMSVHSTSRSYMCDKCKKSLKTENILKQHMGVHSTSKPYTCDECKKSFKHKRSLLMHKKVHSTVRPHVDDKCKSHESELQSKNVLDRHSGHQISGESNLRELNVYNLITNEDGNSIILTDNEALLNISCIQSQNADETNRQCNKNENNAESELLFNDVDEILRQVDTDLIQTESNLLDEYLFFPQNLSFLDL